MKKMAAERVEVSGTHAEEKGLEKLDTFRTFWRQEGQAKA